VANVPPEIKSPACRQYASPWPSQRAPKANSAAKCLAPRPSTSREGLWNGFDPPPSPLRSRGHSRGSVARESNFNVIWRRGSPPKNERNAHFVGIASTYLLATYTCTYASQGSLRRAVENQRYSSAVFQSFSTSVFFPKMELPSSIFGKSALASTHAGYRHGHC